MTRLNPDLVDRVTTRVLNALMVLSFFTSFIAICFFLGYIS